MLVFKHGLFYHSVEQVTARWISCFGAGYSGGAIIADETAGNGLLKTGDCRNRYERLVLLQLDLQSSEHHHCHC